MKNLDLNNFKLANPDKMICFCNQVTQKEIESAIAANAKTLHDVQKMTGACSGNRCKELNPSGRCCSADILRILKNFENSSI